MNIFQKIYYFFSQYTDKTERKIGMFFEKANEDDQITKISQKLLNLIQLDLVRINLLSEKKYKGYNYLTKKKRKQLYNNTQLIIEDFTKFCESFRFNEIDIINTIKTHKVDPEGFNSYHDQLKYLKVIMSYLMPKNNRYSYRQSSTFGELLRPPGGKEMVGDCNQIVTLYIYLYSLRYNVSDLELKTYPGHVALHFQGIDIEATTGEFILHNHVDQRILQIQEIISINLLDITDKNYQTYKISPKLQLQSARLALLFSSEREITIKNLEIAYSNAVANYMQQNDYKTALKFAKQSKDFTLQQAVGNNGSSYFLDNQQYRLAERFAQYSSNKTELIGKIRLNQAISYYNDGQYDDALRLLKRLDGHQDIIKKCYAGMFLNEQKKLSASMTADEIRQHKSVIKNMYYYAKKSESSDIINHVKDLMKYL